MSRTERRTGQTSRASLVGIVASAMIMAGTSVVTSPAKADHVAPFGECNPFYALQTSESCHTMQWAWHFAQWLVSYAPSPTPSPEPTAEPTLDPTPEPTKPGNGPKKKEN